MIGFFPTPYPDELLYSVCARVDALMAFPNHKKTMEALFGAANAVATCALPSHLGGLIAALPAGHGYTVDELIDRHTLLPFFAPFLPTERVRQVREAMGGPTGAGLYTRIGVNASLIAVPQQFRFCPVCADDDLRQFRERYWHRVHQLPGVEVCPVHAVWLEASAVRTCNVRSRHRFLPAEGAIAVRPPRALTRSDRGHQVRLQLARDAAWVLQHPALSTDLVPIWSRYVRLLAARELLRDNGRVPRLEALRAEWVRVYPPDLLQALLGRGDGPGNLDWLLALVRAPRKAQHPVYHLLLIQFLEQTAASFFALPAACPPFGAGPWPCLNLAAAHYAETRIATCAISVSAYSPGPIGTFACDCGFVYIRTGPDRVPEDRLRRSARVVAFGSLWDARLQMLWHTPTVSVAALARELGVDDLTAKRHAERLGLPFPRQSARSSAAPRPRVTSPPVMSVDACATRRAAWLAGCAAYPQEGLTMLRRRMPAVYMWLRRADRLWLDAHRPVRQPCVRQTARVDWAVRDAACAREVEAAIERLVQASGPPRQLTISAIGQDMGARALLQKHLDKLPVTKALLQQRVEDREAFALRRVAWACARFMEEGVCPPRWQLVRRAGLRPETEALPAVTRALQVALGVVDSLSLAG